MFLSASVDKPRAYAGEQVTLTVRFHAGVPLMGSVQYDAPKLEGFLSEDLGQGQTSANHGGRTYHVTEVKTALFPVHGGRLPVGAAVARTSVARGGGVVGGGDLFERFFSMSAPQPVTARSEPVAVEAMPLPDAGRPEGFSGAVGRYRVKATVDRARLKVGEAATLTVEVSGTGNLRSVGEPARAELSALRFFDTESNVSVTKTDGVVGGTKVLKTVFVPRASGVVVIPPLVLWHFDPEKRAYVKAESAALRLDVEAGAPGAAAPGGTSTPALGVVTRDIRYLEARAGPRRRFARARRLRRARRAVTPCACSSCSAPPPPTGAAAASTPSIVARPSAASFAAARAEAMRSARGARSRASFRGVHGRARRLRGRPLRRAGRGADLAARAGPAGVRRRDGRGRRGVRRGLARRRSRALRPAGLRRRRGPRRRREGARRARGAGGPLMIALLLAAALSAPAAAATPAEAKAFYDAGRWEDAAAAFGVLAASDPDEPAWHYGRGGALLKAGRLGPSVAAYERAFALAPRDADARENLDFALRRAGEELAPAGVPPAAFILFTLLSERELAGLLALAAWAALLLAAAALLRRAPPARAAATVLLAAALGLWWAGLRAALPPGRAVIVAPRAELRNGPGPGFTVGATVPEGRRVRVLAERDGWFEVGTLKEGERGWVDAAAIETL